MGAWVTYGLGSECQDLPGFVVLSSGMIPPGGLDCFGSGLPPASFQGSLFQKGRQPVADLAPAEGRPAARRASSTCSASSTGPRPGGWGLTTGWSRPSPTTSWPTACRPPCRG
ncbi:MAG: DUF1501 domain-containing protein [Gemmataceae bacterium]